MSYPFRNCHLCSQTCNLMFSRKNTMQSEILLYCQYCREIADAYEEYAPSFADSTIISEYKRGFLTADDDPKAIMCIICHYRQTIVQTWPSSLTTLCYPCEKFKKNGLPNFVRSDQRCLAQAEYEGHDVPDSWGIHHNSEGCETCDYYRNLK